MRDFICEPLNEKNKEISHLKSVILQQDQELKDLGKALQEARQTTLKGVWEKCYDLMNFQSKQRTNYNPEDSYIPSLECGEIMEILESLGLKKEPLKDEPELVICPEAGKCQISECVVQIPHKKTARCDTASCPWRSGPCIPYKKPTAPQEPASVPKTDMEYLSARMMEIEQRQGRDRADLMVEIRDLIKSTGDLEIRLDNAESAIQKIQENKA